ncbi:MAG: DNA primase [Candidatus Levybacteria bacterium CG_4_10_14_0_2_um_filter_36_16]|nr:MAG: DNA primase [Candidatus Levybacteria bacterium CG2_30_37_29]PIR79335.1 MAG: DNA primase [Candidatus Levybacteria bacterium CG10_big_fil_rev_8_21_14_0_10_36_30]PIZ98013.1 MAG: DNA primase [Candidatus Levybacteria bacterium CG_4_10_14_0_2_um_filter_36_16]PJA90652.1 MAG: DNA primase [Candidatus Levybacteria bacterium CG_4_9_14_3_um_filter_36_7]
MDDVEKVKQKLDIVDVIGEFIPLKKGGRNFKAVCPFHSEKSPSFTVSPERQIWHCFGCAKGGDIFTFVQEYEHLEFGQTLKLLAQKAGIELTQSAFRTERENVKETIYSANNLAAQFYNFLLTKHPVGKKALLYLTQERKIPLALINTFMIGYAPSKSSLSEYLVKKKKYKEEDIEKAGLAFRRGGRLIDFFYERIIFPIQDARSNIIAFSGRVLDAALPKYVNTRETLVYIKGDTVFGLPQARDAIKKEGKVIVVEGEFDVITAHKEGISNIVAVKGTSLTENQIKLLKRFTQKLVFCFDTDPAGTEAQRRSIELIEKEGVGATVVVPPEGKDPDEILRENPIAFKKAVKNDTNIYDFIIDSAFGQFDSKSAEGKKKILEKTLPFLWGIENEVLKEHYLKKLAGVLDASLDAILREVEKIKKPQEKEDADETAKKLPRQEVLEGYLISIILQSKNPRDLIKKAEIALLDIPLTTLSYSQLFSHLVSCSDSSSEFSIEAFTKTLPAELVPASDTCFLAPIPSFSEDAGISIEFDKTLSEVRSLAIKSRLKNLTEEVKNEEKNGQEENVSRLREEFKSLAEKLSSS